MRCGSMASPLRYVLPAVVLAGALSGCAAPERTEPRVEVRESLFFDALVQRFSGE